MCLYAPIKHTPCHLNRDIQKILTRTRPIYYIQDLYNKRCARPSAKAHQQKIRGRLLSIITLKWELGCKVNPFKGMLKAHMLWSHIRSTRSHQLCNLHLVTYEKAMNIPQVITICAWTLNRMSNPQLDHLWSLDSTNIIKVDEGKRGYHSIVGANSYWWYR